MTGLERAKLERTLTDAELPRSDNDKPTATKILQDPLKPVTQAGHEPSPAKLGASLPAPENTSFKPTVAASPMKVVASPGSGAATADAAHLYAGPGITLKGEITGCDTLRIEGAVDGNANARQLVLCAGGSFLGTAEIEDAEIEGNFDGTLNVRGRLLLRGNGRISGTLSYGQIEVERGGEILGQINPFPRSASEVMRSSASLAAPTERRSPVGALKSATQMLRVGDAPPRPVETMPSDTMASPASAGRRAVPILKSVAGRTASDHPDIDQPMPDEVPPGIPRRTSIFRRR